MNHGRKRKEKGKITAEELTKQQETAQKIDEMLMEFLKLRNQPINENSMQLCDLMIKICPDIYTIYNFRREVLLHNSKKQVASQFQATLQQELNLTSKLLKESPKTYSIWNYRQWLVLQLKELEQTCPQKMGVADQEMFLCEKMLNFDQRNFHAWNYRQWLVRDVDNYNSSRIEKELAFTEEKIGQDFSNFSAFHFRSKHLLHKYSQILLKIDQQSESDQNGIKTNQIAETQPSDNTNKSLPSQVQQKITSDENVEKKQEQSPNQTQQLDNDFTDSSAQVIKTESLEQNFQKKNEIDESIRKDLIENTIPLEVIKKELELVKQAIFMQPNEQGVWQYLEWLIELRTPFGIKKASITNTDDQLVLTLEFTEDIIGLEHRLKFDEKEITNVKLISFSGGIYNFQLITPLQDTFQLKLLDNNTKRDERCTFGHKKFLVGGSLIIKNKEITLRIDPNIKTKLEQVKSDLEEEIRFLDEVHESEGYKNVYSRIYKIKFLQALWKLYRLLNQNESILGEQIESCFSQIEELEQKKPFCLRTSLQI